jgi:nucleotide-binding universal stress UspA family protein
MIEIRRILCPVDLSTFSRHALEHARALARRYEARLTVLHVSSIPQPLAPIAGMPGAAYVPPPPVPDRARIEQEVRQFCETASSRQTARADENIVITEGLPSKEILRQADTLAADLLVMGTHGRSGFERLVLGSVTEKVLRTTRVPVLTVPSPVDHVETVEYRTILCPIEFSDPSIRALEHALKLAEGARTHLVLLHVVEILIEDVNLSEYGTFSVSEYYQRLMENARALLRAAVPDDARAWCTPEERVAVGKPYRAILELARTMSPDIIIMGVHGAGALNRRLFGSTAHHVIREANCPVLTLRA